MFDLTTSVWTLGVIGALFESGIAVHLREPCTVDELAARCPSLSRARIERALTLAATAGIVGADGGRYTIAPGAIPFLQPPMRAVIEGDARSHLMQSLAFVDSATKGDASDGWKHTDPKILQAQGDASAAIAPMFKMNMVATMGDLAARLEQPGARFLDVGVGVAALAIGMCRVFPQIHTVGLDVSDVPLAMAKENVARASLTERIELRKLAVGDLRDEQAFDLAWLPTFFIPREDMKAALARIHASIKPGGWLLCAIGSSNGDARQRGALALVSELWGGAVLDAAETESFLKGAGFSTVRQLPGPSFAPGMLVAQR